MQKQKHVVLFRRSIFLPYFIHDFSIIKFMPQLMYCALEYMYSTYYILSTKPTTQTHIITRFTQYLLAFTSFRFESLTLTLASPWLNANCTQTKKHVFSMCHFYYIYPYLYKHKSIT